MPTGLGLRIKQRRTELGLSQEELAERLGLKSKTTICKIERGDDNLTTDRIRRYAEALFCTPSYLMGWEDGKAVNSAEFQPEASADVAKALELYEKYQSAIPEVRAAVETLLKSVPKKS